jgi:EF hand
MPGLSKLVAGGWRWRIPTVRLTRYHLFLLGGLFLMVMGPLAFTQPGPGGKGKGGKGGPSPDKMFNMLSGGKETIEVSKVQFRQWGNGPTAEQQKEQMLTFLQKKGVTNGVMTKAIFPEFWEDRMAERRAQRDGKQKQDGAPPPAPGAAPAPAVARDVEAEARDEFARMDVDKNGSLSVEEILLAGRRGRNLYDERAKWDANKNGTIELPEYIEYAKARQAQRDNGGNPTPLPAIPDPVKPIEENKRPTVYRTGKMPKELPAWFEEADKDKDGQVGLYEWKASGKPINEFMAMDLNGDGFLTVEEVLRYQRVTAKATASPTPNSPGAPSASPSQGDSPRGRGNNGGGNNGGGRTRRGGPKGG